jgi:hypothetical protein
MPGFSELHSGNCVPSVYYQPTGVNVNLTAARPAGDDSSSPEEAWFCEEKLHAIAKWLGVAFAAPGSRHALLVSQ